MSANSRPGAGCPGKPHHLYMCEYIHLQWKGKQPAWGGFIVAALPCPSMHAYRHTNMESKQPAWGGLPGPAHYSFNTCTYIKNTWNNKQPAWGGVPGAALPGPYTHASLHTKWEASSRPGAGCIGPIISPHVCIHTYKGNRQAAGLGVGCVGQPR